MKKNINKHIHVLMCMHVFVCVYVGVCVCACGCVCVQADLSCSVGLTGMPNGGLLVGKCWTKDKGDGLRGVRGIVGGRRVGG